MEKNTVLPSHVEDAIRAVADLHDSHHRGATRLERLTDAVTAAIGKPVFLVYAVLAFAAWLAASWLLPRAGVAWPDPYPYPFLDTILAAIAIFVAVLILASQRRADRLADLREKMTLELAMLTEHKGSKIIELLEELRRDLPNVHNRIDLEAIEMSAASDHATVLEVIADVVPATAKPI